MVTGTRRTTSGVPRRSGPPRARCPRTTTGWSTRPTRRSANSDAERWTSVGTGRSRNRSKVPALMCLEASLHLADQQVGQPEGHAGQPEQQRHLRPRTSRPGESTWPKIAAITSEVQPGDEGLAQRGTGRRTCGTASRPGSAPPTSRRHTPSDATHLSHPAPPPVARPEPSRPARPARAATAQTDLDRPHPERARAPSYWPSHTSTGTWSIDAKGRSPAQPLEPVGEEDDRA